MQLSIISVSRQTTYRVEWIDCNTTQGNYVIQNGHAPTMLVLAPNSTVTFLVTGENSSSAVAVKQGILDVTRENATLLITQDK